MKKLIVAGLVFAASVGTAFATGVQGIAAPASEQPTQGSSQATKVKRDAGGRMQLEPLKAGDFARRVPSAELAAPASAQPGPGPSQAAKVKRDAAGRMQLEPLKAGDFIRKNDGRK